MPLKKVNGEWPLEIKGKHVRARQKAPIKGAFYRTHDVGGNGHTQRIAMYNPKTKRWSTQSWIFPILDVKHQRPSTVKILKRLGKYSEAMNLVNKKIEWNRMKITFNCNKMCDKAREQGLFFKFVSDALNIPREAIKEVRSDEKTITIQFFIPKDTNSWQIQESLAGIFGMDFRDIAYMRAAK